MDAAGMDKSAHYALTCSKSITITDDRTAITATLIEDGRILVGLENGDIKCSNAQLDDPLVLKGHTGPVWALASNYKLFASGDTTGIIRLWNLTGSGNYSFLAEVEGHTSTIRSLHFIPSTNLLASGSRDTTIRIWDISSNPVCTQTITGHTRTIRHLCTAGDYLISSGYDGAVCGWNMQDAFSNVFTCTGHGGAIFSLAYDDKTNTLFSGGEDMTIRLWNSRDGQPITKLSRHCGIVNNMHVKGDRLISSDGRYCIIMWTIDGENTSFTHSVRHTSAVISTDVRQNLLVSGGTSDGVKVWDWTLNSDQAICEDGRNDPIKAVRWIANDKFVVVVNRDGWWAIELWKLSQE